MEKAIKMPEFRGMAKQILVIILLLGSFINTWASEKKIEILQNARELIKKGAVSDEKVKDLLIGIDSIIGAGKVSDTDFVRIVENASTIFRQQGRLTPVIELFLSAISYLEKEKKPSKEQVEMLLQLYIPLGASHEELGMWNRAMEYYMKALDLAEEQDLDNYKAMIYNNIGAIHYNKTEPAKAEKYVMQALEINKRLNNKKELFNNYNNLAGIYFNKSNFDRALDCALRAIQLLDDEKDPYLYYFMQSNIASLYLSKKDYLLAFSYLKNAKTHQEQLNFDYDLIQTYSLFARTYDEMGKTDSARYYLEKSLAQTRKIKNKHLESKILQDLSWFYKNHQDYQKAYQALSESFDLSDSIMKVDNRKKMDDLEKVYDADKKIKENELLIKEITLKKLSSDRRWIILFFISLLLIVAILYLITRARNKEKLRKTDELLLQQQTALYEKEKELQSSKEQELKNTIDQKNRELTSYTLFMIKSNEFISGLSEELKQLLLELNPKDREHKEHVRQILNRLHHQSSTSNWDEFRCYFEQVHPSFYDNLENYFPDLTLKEKRLCAFLRLGLSSKEISAITFKEVRSVESARNRLRKKLGISPEGNLTEFLCYNTSLNNIPAAKDHS